MRLVAEQPNSGDLEANVCIEILHIQNYTNYFIENLDTLLLAGNGTPIHTVSEYAGDGNLEIELKSHRNYCELKTVFISTSSATTIIWPSNVLWPDGGTAPTLEANKRYIFDIFSIPDESYFFCTNWKSYTIPSK